MKYLLFSLTLLLGGIAATAQTHEQVLEYYKNRNLAELAICDSNFAAANKYYQEAFAINSKKAFYHDLINAFYSAMDSHEYGLAERYFAQLMRRGLDSENVRHLKHAYHDEQLVRVNALFAKYPNHMNQLRNEPLMKELTHLVFLDQDVRYHYYNDEHLSDYMTDSTFKVDAMNAQRLLKIIKKNGIPSQAALFETGYNIIMLHNRGAGYGGYESQLFDTLLYKGVFSFNYDANGFGQMVDGFYPKPFSYNNITFKAPLAINWARYMDTLQPDRIDTIYAEMYDSTSEAIINKERAKIGLESLADVRTKMDARNRSIDRNAILHKYSLRPGGTEHVIFDRARLNDWLRVNGKDAPVKKAYNFKAMDHVLEIGKIGDMDAAIDKTSYQDVTKLYDGFIKEYNQGNIYLSNWKNGRPSLNWNCHARVIDNPKEDLSTETGRLNKSQFVAGYKLFVQQGWELFMLNNIIYLFGPDDKLISFKANVGSQFGKVMTNFCGKPDSFTTKYTTRLYKNDQHYKITLTTKRYVWIKDNIKVLVITADELNEKWQKRTYTTYQMMDAPAYTAYLQQVADKKKELDKEYAKVEKR